MQCSFTFDFSFSDPKQLKTGFQLHVCSVVFICAIDNLLINSYFITCLSLKLIVFSLVVLQQYFCQKPSKQKAKPKVLKAADVSSNMFEIKM